MRMLILFVMIFSFSGCATPCRDATTNVITQREFRVIRVIDGDTFVVRYDGELTSVRIAGIDAPERNTPTGPAATAELKRLIAGKTVRLTFTEKRKRDHFGRLLARVTVSGIDAGEKMLDTGHAVAYRPR